MSIGPSGIVPSAAGTPLAQTRGAETSAKEAADRGPAAGQADRADGVDQTAGEPQTGDRDADGRRLWEKPPEKKDGEKSADGDAKATGRQPPLSRDATGTRGNQLDLLG